MFEQQLIKILHVDDNEANRYAVNRMLKRVGFNVIEAATGEAALELVDQARPDLIILDVKLPDLNGFEVCRRLKANPATAFIPVLHLSASFIESRDKAQGLDSGADGYLAQPVEPIELIATVRALLRIRQAEESALTLAQEWQSTFDAMSDGVCLLNEEGRVMRCNSAMTELLHKPFSEIIRCLHQELMPSTLGVVEASPFTLVQETRQRESREVQCGSHWFAVTVDPIFNQGGTFIGAVYILADITDRKQAEEALRVSEERFRLLLENVTDYAIFFLDTQARVIRWSLGAERILGYQEPEILGKPSSIIFTPEDIEQGADQQELEIAVTEGRAENERWHIRKDGSWFWGSGIVTPLRNEQGQIRGFSKIMRDFTERKRAEDERNQLLAREQEARAAAEAANRLKDEFLATLSHELRSPLNAMLGWTRLLNSRQFDAATTARALQTIERSAKSQAQLVEDLLDVSRIIQGKLRLNTRPVELVSVIEAAIETVRPAAQAKEIGLQCVLDPATGPVAGDSDRLQQVIWNLVSNAIKFTPKEGCVQVQLERVNSHVEITVKDTGKGIDPEFVPYVFERFRQADSSSTRVYSGLGLGLAIVRHLVELHGGTVRAHSEGEDKGATFTVKLPRISVVEPSSGEHSPRTVALAAPCDNSPALNGVRVLIVDDEMDSREFLVAALEQCEAKVFAFASAGEALAAISQLKPDVLVSDIAMPLEDGYSLIRKVRQLSAEQGGQIPAIALTAYARAEDRTRAISSGFQMHISKPVEPAELATVVASLAKHG
ncbi:response regulator [Allocoleopsis franciscana]|uniref:Circadian input-output histidine kinase CikA n=1 Tax=Allocoleopsis franciscana PCC 7113 TaxID=1173027 RepID=K9WIT9_9CYAN|nr:response regulator [Allocoleopsis franciscana]AFZ19689.1 PAS domain S-box [Allocoleopsis franciscana PCC 7113]